MFIICIYALGKFSISAFLVFFCLVVSSDPIYILCLLLFLISRTLRLSFAFTCILNSKRNAYFAYLVKCINWGLNTDLMIRKVSLMYGTCVLSNASQIDGSLE